MIKAKAVPIKPFPVRVGIALAVAITACAIYANLSFAVTDKANYKYFPPFQPYVNWNSGPFVGEYYQIAHALAGGEGFSSPFDKPTGPTAWQPPVLPLILAGLLYVSAGETAVVRATVVVFDVIALIGTGFLILALVRQTTARIGAGVAAIVYFGAILCEFRLFFQSTHDYWDYWLVMLAIDLVIAGLCWFGPLDPWQRAFAWGLLGGLCALINPIIGIVWGLLTLLSAFRQRAWSRFAAAVLAAGIALTPWAVRNYLVFGRLIPTKSNLAYELYQAQCLQRDGLLRNLTPHPYRTGGREGQEYKALGEVAYLDRKREQFWEAVWADPLDYLDRAAYRFLAATLWNKPFEHADATWRPWTMWLDRSIHPLPFLALLALVVSTIWDRLEWSQWIVIGVYALYLLPYIGASYYPRYAVPLLGTKILLVLWAVDRLLSAWRESCNTG